MRKTWPDIAKGACIILVVLWHVITKHYLKVEWPKALPIPATWGSLGEQFLPLRMPLFFTISGLFAMSAVDRSWSMVARPRVAKFVYLYSIWLLIHTVVMWFTPDFDTARAQGPLQVIEYLTITPTNLWYLYALALYFVIAKVTRGLPPPLILGAALLLAAAAGAHLLPEPSNRGQVYQNLLFFLLGLYLRPRIERLAETADTRQLLLSGGAFATALLFMAALHAQAWFGVWPVVSVIATVFGVTAAAYIERWSWPSNGLATLGRQTLPIYVMHLPLLAVIDRLLLGPLSFAEPTVLPLAAIEPVLLTAGLVYLCLRLHSGLRKRGVDVLFELPGGRPRVDQLHIARQVRRQPSRPQAVQPVSEDWFQLVAERQRAGRS